MDRRLICWDIDGTLVSCGPAGRLALERGAAVAAGLRSVPEVSMGGKTDPQIVTEILGLAGLDCCRIDQLVPAALAEAQRSLAASRERIRAEGVVHPGVRELLVALDATPGVRQTLVTGNIAPNAALKVSTFGLEGHFDFEVGAYGTDHVERDCLVPIALERARKLRGEAYRPEEVWVIGDTVHDLSCARAAGARCVIVGTGRGSGPVDGLEAEAVVENLADTEALMAILLADSPRVLRPESATR